MVGYHVNVPCKVCLGQPNNGHYWMFRSFEITAQQIFLQRKFALPCSLFFFLILDKVGPMGMDMPLLWGFVRDAGDFSGGYFRTGDEKAARFSCQLSVHLASSIFLIVYKPALQRIIAQTFNEQENIVDGCR